MPLAPIYTPENCHPAYQLDWSLTQSQIQHHPMAEPRVQAVFERWQICDPQVDLARPRQAGTGIFWYNLHVVFVRTQRCREVEESRIQTENRIIQGVSDKCGYLLSRAGIVADHVHLTVGCPPEQSPAEIALRYMNYIAFSYGMKRVFQFGYYVGTFGEYDLGVIPRQG
jgi:REP element-mobilizing transposase RayT